MGRYDKSLLRSFFIGHRYSHIFQAGRHCSGAPLLDVEADCTDDKVVLTIEQMVSTVTLGEHRFVLAPVPLYRRQNSGKATAPAR